MGVEWRESFAYTEEDLERAVRFGWIKKRRFKGGYELTPKGDVHTKEQIRQRDDFRALITPLTDLDDAGRLTPPEKHEMGIAICVCACRLNEERYNESKQALIEQFGFDPEEALKGFKG